MLVDVSDIKKDLNEEQKEIFDKVKIVLFKHI